MIESNLNFLSIKQSLLLSRLTLPKVFVFFLIIFFIENYFQDAVHAYSGGLGNTLKMYDINSNTGTIISFNFTLFIFLSQIYIENIYLQNR